jgi:guanine deaminase
MLSVDEDPLGLPEGAGLSYQADGLLVVEDGVIVARGDYASLATRFADVR